MKLQTLVWREIFERKSQLATSFLAILLGITVIVSIKNITFYSEKAVSREMDSLGANILVLPKSATLQNYYAADMQGDTIPEEYVTQLAMSSLQGLDNLSPKLSVPVEIEGQSFTLTGILPKSEFQAKAAWSGAGIFSRPAGCGAMPTLPFADGDKKTLVRKRVIDNSGERRSPGRRRCGLGTVARGRRQSHGAGPTVQGDSRAAANRHRRRFARLRPSAPRAGNCGQGAGGQCHRNRGLLPGDLQRSGAEDQLPCCPRRRW